MVNPQTALRIVTEAEMLGTTTSFLGFGQAHKIVFERKDQRAPFDCGLVSQDERGYFVKFCVQTAVETVGSARDVAGFRLYLYEYYDQGRTRELFLLSSQAFRDSKLRTILEKRGRASCLLLNGELRLRLPPILRVSAEVIVRPKMASDLPDLAFEEVVFEIVLSEEPPIYLAA